MLKYDFKSPSALLCICLIFTGLGSPALAQQVISGQVIDRQTQKPLPGANVFYNKNKGTTTDSNGNFHIPCENLPLHAKVSFIGYQTFKKVIHHCSGHIRIELIPLSYSLQNITVKGETGRVQVQKAGSAAALGLAELNRQTGLRLRNALNTVPGVRMGSRSPFGGQRIIIRGYYPNTGGKSPDFNGMGYQLYFNNIPITSAAGVTIMDAVDFSNLGRVKILKGPSSFYGNEIGGAVSLYSRRPQREGTTFSEQLLGGRYGLFRNNSSLILKNKNMDMVINYGRQQDGGFRSHFSSKKDYLSFLGDFRISEKQQIHTYVSYSHSSDQLAGMIPDSEYYARHARANPKYVNNNGGAAIKGSRLGVTSIHIFNTHFSNKSTLFLTGGTRKQYFAHGSNFYNDLNYGARTNFTFQKQLRQVGIRGQLGAFLQYSVESDQGVFIPKSIFPPFKPSDPQFPTDLQNDALNYNFFTQWSVNLPLDFKISAGALLNFNKFGIQNMLNNGRLYNGFFTKTRTFHPTFSPSFFVLKSFNQKYSVYVRLSTGNSPALLSDIIQGDGTVNDNLEPEKAVQYEAGSKGNLLNGKLAYKVALFDLKVTNRLAAEHRNGISYTTNVGREQNKGLELYFAYNVLQNAEAPVSNVKIRAGYSYSYFRYDGLKEFGENAAGGDSVTAVYSGNKVAGVAPHTTSLSVDLKTKQGFYLTSEFRYRGKTPVTYDNKKYVRAYNVLSAKAGYRQDFGGHLGINLFVGGDNLTGNTYYNFMFVGPTVKALGDGYIGPAPYKPVYYGQITLKYTI
jgi:iron complex outermembrane receptor protein